MRAWDTSSVITFCSMVRVCPLGAAVRPKLWVVHVGWNGLIAGLKIEAPSFKYVLDVWILVNTRLLRWAFEQAPGAKPSTWQEICYLEIIQIIWVHMRKFLVLVDLVCGGEWNRKYFITSLYICTCNLNTSGHDSVSATVHEISTGGCMISHDSTVFCLSQTAADHRLWFRVISALHLDVIGDDCHSTVLHHQYFITSWISQVYL